MSEQAEPGPERMWNQRDIVAEYATRAHISSAEVRVIGECWSHILGGRVLDLGIGTGRTIPFFAPFAARYVGTDFMPNMVAEAKRQHPGRDLRQADARDLPFGDGEFSFVLFSFNGIDCNAPRDRQRILAEVHRVLAPGGIFAYSSHNLNSRVSPRSRFVPELPVLSASPLRTAVRVARALGALVRGYRNYRRLAPLQQVGDGISYIMDGAHDYRMMACYVTHAHERRALAEAGYAVHAMIDLDGSFAAPTSRASSFYVIAERLDRGAVRARMDAADRR